LGEKLLNFMLDEEVHKELKLLAAREGRSIKDILIEQIKDYVKIHKEGNPQHLLSNYTDNEDFLGFPSMAIKTQNKRTYLKKMPEKMREQMKYHLQEWVGMLKEL